MVQDAEVFAVIYEILREVGFGSEFRIKCNNRLILDGIFAVAGVPQASFRPICSAVDKLDKMPWDAVKREMVEEKGLDPECADRIGKYVQRSGKAELVEELLQDSMLAGNLLAKQGLLQMRALWKYFGIYGLMDRIWFDLSLARGLDYYTGVILEAVLEGAEVGSIAGGGRYDNLVGMFSARTTSSDNGQTCSFSGQIPCVGATFGIERVFAILEARARSAPTPPKVSPTQVYIAVAGGELLPQRMLLAKHFWQANIPCEFSPKPKPRPLDQFEWCEKNAVPIAVVLGPGELEKGVVKVREVAKRSEDLVPIDEVVAFVKTKLVQLQELREQNGQTQETLNGGLSLSEALSRLSL